MHMRKKLMKMAKESIEEDSIDDPMQDVSEVLQLNDSLVKMHSKAVTSNTPEALDILQGRFDAMGESIGEDAVVLATESHADRRRSLIAAIETRRRLIPGALAAACEGLGDKLKAFFGFNDAKVRVALEALQGASKRMASAGTITINGGKFANYLYYLGSDTDTVRLSDTLDMLSSAPIDFGVIADALESGNSPSTLSPDQLKKICDKEFIAVDTRGDDFFIDALKFTGLRPLSAFFWYKDDEQEPWLYSMKGSQNPRKGADPARFKTMTVKGSDMVRAIDGAIRNLNAYSSLLKSSEQKASAWEKKLQALSFDVDRAEPMVGCMYIYRDTGRLVGEASTGMLQIANALK